MYKDHDNEAMCKYCILVVRYRTAPLKVNGSVLTYEYEARYGIE